MPFNISIKADSSAAEQQIDRLLAKLAAVEGSGPRAGTAITKGAKDSEQAVKGLAAGLANVDSHLAKIEAHKGLEVEGSFGKSIAGQFGELGELTHGLSGGKIAAGAAVGLGVELIHLNDEYTKLQQSALRLVPSIDAVSGAIDKQAQISRDIHSSLEQTIELAVVLKERTEELNVGEQELEQLQLGLGSAATLSGKSAASAGEAFGAFLFNVENGLPSARSLRTVLREFPPLADAIGESMGKSSKEILAMAKAGKLSADQVLTAIESRTPELVAKASKVPETLGQRWDHFKDSAVNAIGTVAGAVEKFNPIAAGSKLLNGESLIGGENTTDQALAMLANEVGPDSELAKIMGAGGQKGGESLRLEFDAELAKVPEMIRAHKNAVSTAAKDLADGIEAQLAKVTVNDIVRMFQPNFTAFDATAGNAGLARMGNELKLITTNATGVQKARDELVALKDAFNHGGISALEFRSKYQSLVTTIEGGVSAYRKVANEISDANRSYHEDVAALGALYKQGVIGIELQEAALKKLKNPIVEAKEELKKYFDELDERRDKDRDLREKSGIGGNGSLSDDERTRAEQQAASDDAEGERRRQLIKEQRDEQQRAFEEREKMGQKAAEFFKKTAEEEAKSQAELGKKFVGALEPFNNAIAELVTKGKVDFKSLIDGMIADLIRLGLKMAEEKALMSAFGGGAGKTGLSGVLGSGGGGGGGLDSAISGALGAIPLLALAHGGDFLVHAATGFSGTVGGFGGTDSRLFMAAVTPGEHIGIHTPQQVRDASAPGPSAPSAIHIHNVIDRQELVGAMNSRAGEQVIKNVIKTNASLIRSYLGM